MASNNTPTVRINKIQKALDRHDDLAVLGEPTVVAFFQVIAPDKKGATITIQGIIQDTDPLAKVASISHEKMEEGTYLTIAEVLFLDPSDEIPLMSQDEETSEADPVEDVSDPEAVQE